MDILNAYIANPCGTLSIPFWKAKTITLPSDMLILHEKDFSFTLLENYTDEIYFRLFHSLITVDKHNLRGIQIETAEKNNSDDIVTIINASYDDIHVDKSQIESYKTTVVYDPELWVIAIDKETQKPIGCGIADYDKAIGELILEWIQVLPEHREKGIGSIIVNNLLLREQKVARFATVSGKVGSFSNPERLYRKCGFIGQDYWHILHKK
jgi:hypothetical protein